MIADLNSVLVEGEVYGHSTMAGHGARQGTFELEFVSRPGGLLHRIAVGFTAYTSISGRTDKRGSQQLDDGLFVRIVGRLHKNGGTDIFAEHIEILK